MYEKFFALRDAPFRLTPDPAYLFLDESRKEALQQVGVAIKRGEGFFSLTGEVGMGKTMLCHALVRALDPKWLTSLVFHTIQTPRELLRSIMRDFGGTPRSEGRSEMSLIDQLNTYLLKQHAEGKVCLLIIDEAQGLSDRALEMLRMLSNLETERAKLVHTLLVGQPELSQKLARPTLRQLDQRISIRMRLTPMTAAGVRGYIQHRLNLAGGKDHKARFTDAAWAAVHTASGGNPRLTNLVADRTLLAGYARASTTLERQDVERAVHSLNGDPETVGDPLRLLNKPVSTRAFP